ncbi:MAG: carbohydrate binding family 9 domain-containing protein [Gemmatimonadetes bacterium]|nr:carbohydrate binding family 9 domain-containing protein [Gemmatimonadota bacterium]
MPVPRAHVPPLIDGTLDDPAWSSAAVLSDFLQVDPGDNAEPWEETVAYVTYTSDALYIAVRAYERDPYPVRYLVHPRDVVFEVGQDRIGMALDTFNDRRRAYVFAVNPIGQQGDGVVIEGGDFAEWNGIFYSAGRVDSLGWTVELEIPFKTLRFPRRAVQDWGFRISRHYIRGGEDSWTGRDRDLACDLCQMGELVGLEGISPGLNLDVNPEIIFRRVSSRQSLDDPYVAGGLEGRLGLNVRYGLTPSLALDATWNPDFSQVEADAGQLDINNRFALFFPELRPFFLEGRDAFAGAFLGSAEGDPGFGDATPLNLVYTRRIADPVWGGKLTGKVGQATLGVIAALDESARIRLDPFSDGLDPQALHPFPHDRAWFGVARVKWDVLEDGFIGATYTGRDYAGGYNRVGSADARLRLTPTLAVRGQVIASWDREPGFAGPMRAAVNALYADPDTAEARFAELPEELAELDGERRADGAWNVALDFDSRHWSGRANIAAIGPDFVSRTGFFNRVGYGRFGGQFAYLYQGTGFLRRISPFVSFDRYHTIPEGREAFAATWGGREEENMLAGLEFTLPGNTQTGVSRSRAFLLFDGRRFSGQDGWGLWFNTDAWQGFLFDVFVNFGESVIFDDVVLEEGAKPGWDWTVSGEARIRPVRALQVRPSVRGSRVWRRTDERARDNLYATAIIPRLRLEYQFSLPLGLRVITEYRRSNFYHPDGPRGESEERLSFEFLLTYQLAAGRAVHLAFAEVQEGENGDPLTRSTRGGVAKATYVWRF